MEADKPTPHCSFAQSPGLEAVGASGIRLPAVSTAPLASGLNIVIVAKREHTFNGGII